jgi:tetratricopeptide (TPR) repeat protein
MRNVRAETYTKAALTWEERSSMADGSDLKIRKARLEAGSLMVRKQYRQAIPFFEEAIQLLSEQNKPIAMSDMLWRVGQCYTRIGLRDHAAVRLRAALRILREYPGDDHLPAVLLELGNALRKGDPGEAEGCYNEAAELYVARKQLELAAAAWVNLGIMCSEQERFEESLAHYEKARDVRERSPSVKPSRIGVLLNNMANCQRRMGNYDEAHKLVDRAVEFLSQNGDPGPAAAYGTRGLIFMDSGNDAEAVEWLQESYAERKKASSPNFETIAENLEKEIVALKRLGRMEEAALAEDRLALARAAMNEIPQPWIW